ncbi:hypothetical protein DPSP01_005003 [Paraphaeosphaeria sporulosa]|uniref:Uncharacterized protein n=1 Tax=Paraphaeosphaeria sporulosa TaxID=1460663 RepID=A0A177BZW5_9PLEO|nr:uncharacterized protein CC84DRAFT_1168132 [Paraphaeosphaeria sporulosa]OAG00923.1 hypothetical protein CC84DRAFT_1168132 [Paraphaeosphaeria sporulosa]
MSHSWLQRKRKGELLELAQKASIPDADTLLKDDLVAALEETLEANETTFAKQRAFSEFYGRGGSPIKRERSSPDAVVLTKTRSRRQTLNRNGDSPDGTSTPDRPSVVSRALAKTPREVSQVTRRVSERVTEATPRAPQADLRATEVNLPASPAQLADFADESFQVVKERATEIWDKTRIDEAKEWLRETASSVSAIQTLILILEAATLQYNTLTDTHYLFDSPATTGFNAREVRFPNLTKLAGSGWWGPATLWSLTNWALPLIFSYFFNLTLRTNTRHKSSKTQYTIDPFTFNIAKAILAYSAYYVYTTADASLLGQPNTVLAQTPGWGPFSESSVATVRDNILGGYYGIQIGSLVGVLVSLYDAALKK